MNPGAQYVFVFLDTLYFAAAFAAMLDDGSARSESDDLLA